MNGFQQRSSMRAFPAILAASSESATRLLAGSDVREAGDGRVLAIGALRLVGDIEIASFSTLHAIDDSLIAAAHHYVTDPDMLEYLGLVR